MTTTRKVAQDSHQRTTAAPVQVLSPRLVLLQRWRAALRAWLRGPDVRAALMVTLGLRVFCSMVATALPLLLPAMYPWRSPLPWVPHDARTAVAQPAYTPLDYLVRPWERWDTVWYADIAQHGYAKFGISAFLPLYPLLMRLTAPLAGGDVTAAGLLVSTVAAFFAFVGLYRLVGRLAPGRGLGPYALLVAAVLPTSFFFMAAYTEATFLALTLWAMLAALERRWWRAAVLGGCASLTRQQGVLIAVVALPEVWRWARWLWGRTWPRLMGGRERLAPAALPDWRPLAAVAAPALTFGAWLVVLRLVVHAPLPWEAVVGGQGWNLHLTWPWSGLLADLATLVSHPPVGLAGVLQSPVLDLAASCGAGALLLLGWRRLARGITLYCAAIWLTSVVKVLPSGLAVSEARYMLQMLPLCVIPAGWLARGEAWWRVAWLAGGMTSMALYLWIFVLWGWVG